MKKLLSLAAFIGSFVAAHAQWNTINYVPGGTNNVPATTTNTTFTADSGIGVLTLPLHDVAPIQISFKLTSTGTSAVVFKFDQSLDNSVWNTDAYSITVTAAGTTVVNGVGKFTLNGIPFLRLNRIENPNANAITNLTVVAIQKNQPVR